MSENGHANGLARPIPSGGASTALDMQSERDRGLVRQAVKNWPKRWRGVTARVKDEVVVGLRKANRIGVARMRDAKAEVQDAGAAIAISAAKTLVAIEGQNQGDDHLAEKYSRRDAGLDTERTAVRLYDRAAPTEEV